MMRQTGLLRPLRLLGVPGPLRLPGVLGVLRLLRLLGVLRSLSPRAASLRGSACGFCARKRIVKAGLI